ncbi:hypothetical protein [Salidesulfovibrio brasiliensis]|uniref:hypothetical protein n=1 Tax=Salidesulfovibrio brasiliensis TaxID=221711 RepID=UPI0006D26ECE|nr:hypothetical protein [Salidesulfovibrio brasiliensis]
MIRLIAVLLLVATMAPAAMADEVITIRKDLFCSVHEINFGTRTFDCVKGAVIESRWICEFEGEVTCRLEGDEAVTRTFANPFNGHICRRLCKPQ